MASVCDELQIVKRSSGGTGLWLWFKLETETLLLDDSLAWVGGLGDLAR